MVEPAIDVIDIGPYLAGDPDGRKRVVRAVGAACERIGFLVIAGHGIPDGLVRRVFDVSLAFFDLPLAEKLAVRSDDPGIPRGYSALATKSLGRTYGLDAPPICASSSSSARSTTGPGTTRASRARPRSTPPTSGPRAPRSSARPSRSTTAPRSDSPAT